VAGAVAANLFERGILICGTGLGMSMAANKFARVRAALCTDLFSAIMSRKHNDANILVLGARVTGPGLALEIVKAFLETDFEGGRHQKRIDKFNTLCK
jgi:ribose 5-phosphate isomerase B